MIDRDTDPRLVRFEGLYRAHRLQIIAYCARRTSEDKAADACAETFLVAWRRLDELPRDDRVLPYLYGVAAKVLANQWRSERRRAMLVTRLGSLGTGPTIDTASTVVRGEEQRIVVAAVRRLPPRDREVVMLHDWEELSRQQIAEVVGVSKAAVDKRLSRAYRRLGRQLEPLLERASPARETIAEDGAT